MDPYPKIKRTFYSFINKKHAVLFIVFTSSLFFIAKALFVNVPIPIYPLILIASIVASIMFNGLVSEKLCSIALLSLLISVVLFFIAKIVLNDTSLIAYIISFLGGLGLALITDSILGKVFSLFIFNQNNVFVFGVILLIMFSISLAPSFFMNNASIIEDGRQETALSNAESKKDITKNTKNDVGLDTNQQQSPADNATAPTEAPTELPTQAPDQTENYNEEEYIRSVRVPWCRDFMNARISKYQAEMDKATSDYNAEVYRINDRYSTPWDDVMLKDLDSAALERLKQLDIQTAYNSYKTMYNLAQSMRDQAIPDYCVGYY